METQNFLYRVTIADIVRIKTEIIDRNICGYIYFFISQRVPMGEVFIEGDELEIIT